MTYRTPADHVAANIRAELARAGISQASLAASLGITQQALSRRLLGKTPFSFDEAFAIADTLGVPVSEILPTRPAVA